MPFYFFSITLFPQIFPNFLSSFFNLHPWRWSFSIPNNSPPPQWTKTPPSKKPPPVSTLSKNSSHYSPILLLPLLILTPIVKPSPTPPSPTSKRLFPSSAAPLVLATLDSAVPLWILPKFTTLLPFNKFLLLLLPLLNRLPPSISRTPLRLPPVPPSSPRAAVPNRKLNSYINSSLLRLLFRLLIFPGFRLSSLSLLLLSKGSAVLRVWAPLGSAVDLLVVDVTALRRGKSITYTNPPKNFVVLCSS